MTQVVRLGIVGCGEVVQTCHLPSLALLPELFRVVAVCDVSATVRAAIGARTGASHQLADYRDLIGLADVDAVLVTNPHIYHAEVVLAALAAGKHVLVEKPMCVTLGEADAIIAAERAAGRVVQVGTMRRYAPAFLAAVQQVRSLGEIRLARVHDVIGRNALITQQVSRLARGSDVPAELVAAGQTQHDRLVNEALGAVTPALQTAYQVMLGLSTHDLSAMRELIGMPQRVLYAAQRLGGRYLTAAFDYGDYVCHFETGVDEVPRFDGYLMVYGADRVVRVDYDTPYVRHLPVRLTVTAANGSGGATTTIEHPNWGDPFIEEWRVFHDNVTNRRPAKTSPADFRQDLELFAAMINLMRRPADAAPTQ